MQNFRALGAPSPDPQNSPPIANFWLHAGMYPRSYGWSLCRVSIIVSLAVFETELGSCKQRNGSPVTIQPIAIMSIAARLIAVPSRPISI